MLAEGHAQRLPRKFPSILTHYFLLVQTKCASLLTFTAVETFSFQIGFFFRLIGEAASATPCRTLVKVLTNKSVSRAVDDRFKIPVPVWDKIAVPNEFYSLQLSYSGPSGILGSDGKQNST